MSATPGYACTLAAASLPFSWISSFSFLNDSVLPLFSLPLCEKSFSFSFLQCLHNSSAAEMLRFWRNRSKCMPAPNWIIDGPISSILCSFPIFLCFSCVPPTVVVMKFFAVTVWIKHDTTILLNSLCSFIYCTCKASALFSLFFSLFSAVFSIFFCIDLSVAECYWSPYCWISFAGVYLKHTLFFLIYSFVPEAFQDFQWVHAFFLCSCLASLFFLPFGLSLLVISSNTNWFNCLDLIHRQTKLHFFSSVGSNSWWLHFLLFLPCLLLVSAFFSRPFLFAFCFILNCFAVLSFWVWWKFFKK